MDILTPFKILNFPEDKTYIDLFKTCRICTDETDEILWLKHGCNAHYCVECYSMWLSTKIKENIVNIKCANCPEYLQKEDEILPYLDKDILQKYLRMMAVAMLVDIPGFCWCPKEGCGNGFIIDDSCSFAGCDICKTNVCGKCKEVYHNGETCEEYKARKSESDESFKQSIEWKKMNTKNCPKCKAPAEKASGCDHVTCTVCGTEYCFKCGARYTPGHMKEAHPNTQPPPPVPTEFINRTIEAQRQIFAKRMKIK